MIRHIVLIQCAEHTTDSDMAAIFAELADIRHHVAGIQNITAGKSTSPERIERGYLHGFVVDFDDWAALAAYQAHPAHQAVSAQLVAAARGGIDGILVFDLDTSNPL